MKEKKAIKVNNELTYHTKIIVKVNKFKEKDLLFQLNLSKLTNILL